MKIVIPEKVLLDEGYQLDYRTFNLYFVLYQMADHKNRFDFSIKNTELKNVLEIGDNRTIKKGLDKLKEQKLLHSYSLNNQSHVKIKLMEVKENIITSYIDIRPPYKIVSTLRLILYYDYMKKLQLQNKNVDYSKFFTYEHLKERYGIAYSTISKTREEIGEHRNLLHLLEKTCLNETQENSIEAIFQKDDGLFDDFSENSLEKELCSNISIIEEGLIFLDRQVKVEHGRIDILAMDLEGNTCIIEVKITDSDKRLPYQCAYYPTCIDGRTRMMVIAPSYREDILIALKHLNVELLTYTLDKNNKLIRVDYCNID